MKKILSAILGAALVASMSVTAFAAVAPSAGSVFNSDGDNVTGSPYVSSTAGIQADGINPNTTFYYSLGDVNSNAVSTSGAAIGSFSGNAASQIATSKLVNTDYFTLKVEKKTNSNMIKSITVDSEKKLSGATTRAYFLKVALNESTTTSEIKSDGKITFTAKADSSTYTGTKAVTGSTWKKGDVVTIPYTLWISNTKVSGSDNNAGTGDRIVFEPAKNETNTLIWGDDRAALKFEANDDASKFYARLQTKADSNIYAQYGDPVGADLWFYDFVGNPTVPATSRATLTLGIPWDTSADYVPNPEDCFIYQKDADGYLVDVTDQFSYSEDAGEIEGWSIKTRTLGTYIVSDTELELDVADDAVDAPTTSSPTTSTDKPIPNTGSSDMVNVAVVAAVVSLAAAGAVAFRKVK